MTSTKKKYDTIRHNLKGFREWKRNIGLPYFDVSFDYFDDYGLQSFVDYLSDYKRYKNSTIKKDIVMLKVVLRWAYNSGIITTVPLRHSSQTLSLSRTESYSLTWKK